jgi:hypothetical protein
VENQNNQRFLNLKKREGFCKLIAETDGFFIGQVELSEEEALRQTLNEYVPAKAREIASLLQDAATGQNGGV